MNDSYSIGFSSTPQPKRDPEVVRKLTEESFAVLARSEKLNRQAEEDFILIEQFCEKHKDVDPEAIGYEERESMQSEGEKLVDLIRQRLAELRKIEEDYNDISNRVNTYYGKDLLPKYTASSELKQMYEELLDDVDWWKKE